MTNKRCQRCGLVNFTGTAECRRCNAPISWDLGGTAGQPDFSPQPAFSAGGAFHEQQPFQGAPSLPHYEANAGRYVSPYAQSRKLQSGLATASLVLGILGLFTAGLFVLGSLIGIILGVRAMRRARREPSVYGGHGMAIGGIVTNSIGILSIALWAIVLSIAIPNLLLSRMAVNEAGAIGLVRTLANAEASYKAKLGHGMTFVSMEDLMASGMIPRNSANRFGYTFKIRILDRKGSPAISGSNDANRFEVVATPNGYGTSGRRSFYASEDLVIRGADKLGKEATHLDPSFDDHAIEQRSTSVSGEPPIGQGDNAAIRHLQRILTSEATFQATNGAGAYGSMEDLINNGQLPQDSRSQGGYQFRIRLFDRQGNAASSGTGAAVRFVVVATPVHYGLSTRKSFYAGEDYVIRGADNNGEEATSGDPPVEPIRP